MTGRKFTPPTEHTEFPVEYADGNVVQARTPLGWLIGHDSAGKYSVWYSGGEARELDAHCSPLTDKPKRVVVYVNAYAQGLSGGNSTKQLARINSARSRLKVFEVSYDEDGSDPQIKLITEEGE